MKTIPRCLAVAFALAWLANGGDSLRAQSPVYTANTDTVSVPKPGVVHFLQVINLAQGPGTYTINQVIFSAYFDTGDTQDLLLYFYSGVDTDPSSPSALAPATLVRALRGDLPPGSPVPGGFKFTFTPDPSVTVTTSDGSVGVEFYLTTADASAYSSTAYGRFTPAAPTVGSAAGYVWNDGNLDGVFTGAEQTRFGMTNANTRLALTGTLVQPAPSLKTFARSGTTATLTVDSYTGVNYQLQRATSLTTGNWTNVGGVAAGANGTVQTFTDTDGTDPAAFYRVLASVPAAGGRPAVSRATPSRR